MAKTGPKKDWTEEDNVALAVLWHKFSSVALIALALHRTRSSVQTHASRQKLPRVRGGGARHRQRWTAEEDADLVSRISQLRRSDGYTPVIELSEEIGRSIDAIMDRLEEIDQPELLKCLWVPSLEDLLGKDSEGVKSLLELTSTYAHALNDSPSFTEVTTAAGQIIKKKKWPAEEECLKCGKRFISDGPGNRICPRCKKINADICW
ncbi:hypothetical protein [Acetobacter persici]|uniref:hypothetical protein n=1 Tax=Acetobacter persici TaxID=1076596 RepID=UPI0012FD56FE|nr:hypothetical protein [Acetobacter persici]